MDNSKTYLVASLAGMGAVAILWLLFPPTSNFLSNLASTTTSVEDEPLALVLSIEKTLGSTSDPLSLESVNQNRDLSNAIRQVEIQYIGELWCHSQPIPPNALGFCEQATFSANITRSSAESMAQFLPGAIGEGGYEFNFGVDSRGAYSVTISDPR